MEDISLIHEDHLQRVINLMRASYSHLLFDLEQPLHAHRPGRPCAWPT